MRERGATPPLTIIILCLVMLGHLVEFGSLAVFSSIATTCGEWQSWVWKDWGIWAQPLDSSPLS